jgi:hypothetical protein
MTGGLDPEPVLFIVRANVVAQLRESIFPLGLFCVPQQLHVTQRTPSSSRCIGNGIVSRSIRQCRSTHCSGGTSGYCNGNCRSCPKTDAMSQGLRFTAPSLSVTTAIVVTVTFVARLMIVAVPLVGRVIIFGCVRKRKSVVTLCEVIADRRVEVQVGRGEVLACVNVTELAVLCHGRCRSECVCFW